MHPILSSRTRLSVYLAFWALVALLLAVAYASASPASWPEALIVGAPLVIFYAFVCLSAWYVCNAAPLSLATIGRVAITQFISTTVTTSLWILGWEGWTYMVQGVFDESVVHYRSQLPLVVASGVLLYWSAALFHYLLIAFEKSRKVIARGLELEVLAREAELKALRAQIDPHFLFNSLNSISALTTTDPGGAREMCILLAEFFRNCVRLGKEDQVPLAKEVEMARNYLDIERIRCGSRLTSRIDLGEECDSCQVPPLILQPLVENAVRYGVHSRTDAGNVALEASCTSGSLVLRVENSIDADASGRKGTGVGLANVRRRIRALFGNEADLVTHASQGIFRAELHMPCMSGSAKTRK